MRPQFSLFHSWPHGMEGEIIQTLIEHGAQITWRSPHRASAVERTVYARYVATQQLLSLRDLPAHAAPFPLLEHVVSPLCIFEPQIALTSIYVYLTGTRWKDMKVRRQLSATSHDHD